MRDNAPASPRHLSEFRIKDEFIGLYKQLPAKLNLFVVSNQPDIARKLMGTDALESMHSQLKKEFAFKEILYCPHDNADNCECRKPKPGMISKLLSKYDLMPDNSILIGDSAKDILAGYAAGIKTIYWQQDYNPLIACKPNFVIDKLSDMLDIIGHSSG